jgi:hypothetical protein
MLRRISTFDKRAERRGKESRIRFESQKQKAQAHAVKMEALNLKLEAQKLRNQRLQKTGINVPAPGTALPQAA